MVNEAASGHEGCDNEVVTLIHRANNGHKEGGNTQMYKYMHNQQYRALVHGDTGNVRSLYISSCVQSQEPQVVIFNYGSVI